MAKKRKTKRPKSLTTRVLKTRKKRKSIARKIERKKKSPAKKKPSAYELGWCPVCSRALQADGMHDCTPITEDEVIAKMDEDLADAFHKIRAFATELGEQRIYASEKAIMFAKRICYLFVRPKKSYLEVCFFGPEAMFDASVGKLHQVSKTRISHMYRVTHADQVEEPLTDWIRESFEKTN